MEFGDDAMDQISTDMMGALRLTPGDKAQLQQFFAEEQQKANVQKTVHGLTEICFKKCISGSISSGKLASKEESCVQNCVGRFFDSNIAVLKHLETLRGRQ